jgi:dipeptidyl aminopeptidase/acylaminoacyl peptidase
MIHRQRVAPLVGLVVFALLPSVAGAQAPSQKRPLNLDDLARMRSVNDPQLSPDGTWVAYTVGAVDTEKDKRDTDVWMTSWDGAQHVRLTSTPDGESRPRWSPDGRYLAFLASRGTEDEKKKGSQVWLLNRAGGEAEKLTDVKGGVDDYAWSPDSKHLVLVVTDEDPTDEPEKMDGWKRKTKPPIVIDRYWFKQDRTGYLRPYYPHLWLFDVAGRKAAQLTSGPHSDQAPAWSPDGSRIAFVSTRSTTDPDRTRDSNVFVVEARIGAEPRQLTTFVGPDQGPLAWSPDGKWVAYTQGDEPRFSAYQLPKLAIVPAGGGTPRVLTTTLDRSVSGQPAWSADGSSLTFVVADDRAQYIGRVAVAGGAVQKLTTGRRVVSAVSSGSGGVAAVLAASNDELPEVHAFEGGALRKLSRQNDAWLSEIQLGTVEDFTSTSKDGTSVNGLMFKPAGFVAGRRYPTLLIIHGGPNGQDDYSFDFERQFFAANGYVVLAVNYRGSSGRGTDFQKAIYADWGGKEVVDLIGAVDKAIAMGVADPERLGLGGWSYGGILTDYAIATDQRFKAAASGASSALQLSMYGSDQYITQYELELGQPWKTKDLWLKISYPFFEADKIRTPTLFLCGEKDFNVPVIGVEQMYQALKSLGVDTQLVIYPGQFHGISMPSYARDRLERYLSWFDKHLKDGGTPTAGQP